MSGTDESRPQDRPVLLSMLLFYGLMALVALALRAMVVEAPIRLLSDARMGWGMQGLLGVAGGLLLLASSEVSLRRSEGARALERWLRTQLRGVSAPVALLLALVSAAAEELFFRGAALSLLGLVGSSLFFGIVHVGPAGARVWWMIWATMAGLLFGALTLWTGAILAPFLAHLVVNGVNLVRLSTPSRSR